MPAARSLAEGALPIGLAHRVPLVRDVPAGAVLRWRDVAIDEADVAVQARRDMERSFAATAATRAA